MATLDSRLDGKTYVVGVGVQKAGTSWLHDYLSRQPDIYTSPRKEMHYFDARFAPGATRIRHLLVRQLKKQAERMLAAEDFETFSPAFIEAADRVRMHYDDKGYPDYFASRVGSKRLFGEITPSYCLIGENGFRHMKSLFPSIRVIYIMRDPVDRHLSFLRMTEEGRGQDGYALKNFISSLERGFARQMCDYRSHLEALRAVFAPEELFIGFYERLFTDAEIGRLCSFLGIPFASGNFGTRIRTSGTAADPTPEMIAEAVSILKPTYDYVRETIADVPETWRA